MPCCRQAIFFCLLTLGVTGCGGPAQVPVYAVSGKVSGGSGSLDGVQIVFNSTDPQSFGAQGTIGADGSYKLALSDGRAGCPVGTYKVTLALGPKQMQTAMQSAGAKPGTMKGPPKFEAPFPKEFSSPSTSPKEVNVKAEVNTIDISL